MLVFRIGVLAVSLVAGAAVAKERTGELPTVEFVAGAEALNYDLPSATKTPGGEMMIEFGSTAEIRNLQCRWVDPKQRQAKCSYDYRIDSFGQKSDWVTTNNEFSRDRKGQFVNNCRPSEARLEPRR